MDSGDNIIFALNGNLIVDEANKDKTESSVKVISKDEDANTITVDGGEWSLVLTKTE